jgi:AAA15 family ATPase/GTPase
MLLRFGVENHASIRTYQEISLVASKLKGNATGLFPLTEGVQREPSRSLDELRAVPILALYGANASGKSTLLNAFSFFVSGIVTSHAGTSSNDRTPYKPFRLDESSRTRPSRYDADFVLGELRYHYGYALDGKRVCSEWLYSYPIRSARQTRTVLFFRDASATDEFYFGKQLKGENKQISKLVRANSLYLSAAAQNAHPQLVPIHEFFASRISQRFDASESTLMPEQLVAYFAEDESRRALALNFLRSADIGISGMDFSKVPIEEKTRKMLEELEELLSRHMEKRADLGSGTKKERAKVELLHFGEGKRSYPITLDSESAGTISLLTLLGPTLIRLSEGGVMVIDELNSTLHPIVSRELIRLFSNPQTNPGRAQLLFSTHDTNLLSSKILRRDQIWFAEKDHEGATHIYSMGDMKVRPTDNLEAGYLAGRFGAIPFVGGERFLASNPVQVEVA